MVGLLKSPQKKVKTERKSVSSAHKLDNLGKLKEHAPHSEHVHLHQDIGHIQWLQWLQWGVTFSQVVWLIGC